MGNIKKESNILYQPIYASNIPAKWSVFCSFFIVHFQKAALFIVLLTLSMVCSNQTVFGHGDLHERIVIVSKEIKENPDSAFLYFKRGSLYFQHESCKKAIKDLKKASKKGYQNIACDLLYAKSYKKLGKYKKALLYADKIQSNDSENVHAIKLKAQIAHEQKQYSKAALNFEKLIEKSEKTLPENYIDASLAWELTGTEEGKKEAVHVIKHGIEDLGELFVFYEYLRDLYIKYDSFNSALEVQNDIIERSNRKESAYYKAAEICLLSNNNDDALNYLNAAATAIESLPLRLQNTDAMQDLKANIIREKIKL